MGFEVFIQFHRYHEPAAVPRDAVRGAFGPHLSDVDRNCWEITYDNNNSCTVFLSEDHNGFIKSLTISRPCADIRLWDSLAAILRIENSVLYFPGGRNLLSATPTAAQHLPPDMIEELGQPVVISTGSDITSQIQLSP